MSRKATSSGDDRQISSCLRNFAGSLRHALASRSNPSNINCTGADVSDSCISGSLGNYRFRAAPLFVRGISKGGLDAIMSTLRELRTADCVKCIEESALTAIAKSYLQYSYRIRKSIFADRTLQSAYPLKRASGSRMRSFFPRSHPPRD